MGGKRLTRYRKDAVCSHCGGKGRLSKNLCMPCYSRLRTKGHVERDNARAGEGHISAKGYLCFRIKGKLFYAHRIAAELYLGRPLLPGEVVHHIDGNKLNNNADNLQVLNSQSDHNRLHHAQGDYLANRATKPSLRQAFFDYLKKTED